MVKHVPFFHSTGESSCSKRTSQGDVQELLDSNKEIQLEQLDSCTGVTGHGLDLKRNNEDFIMTIGILT